MLDYLMAGTKYRFQMDLYTRKIMQLLHLLRLSIDHSTKKKQSTLATLTADGHHIVQLLPAKMAPASAQLEVMKQVTRIDSTKCLVLPSVLLFLQQSTFICEDFASMTHFH